MEEFKEVRPRVKFSKSLTVAISNDLSKDSSDPEIVEAAERME